MARIDHAAFETTDPDGLAAFYERILDACGTKGEGHPVMASRQHGGEGDPRR